MCYRLLKILFVTITCIVAIKLPALAATQTGPVQILKISDPTSGNKGMLIQVSGTMISEGCAGGFYALNESNANYKTQSAMVMASYLSGKPIDMYVGGSSGGFYCTFGYPTILWFNISN